MLLIVLVLADGVFPLFVHLAEPGHLLPLRGRLKPLVLLETHEPPLVALAALHPRQLVIVFASQRDQERLAPLLGLDDAARVSCYPQVDQNLQELGLLRQVGVLLQASRVGVVVRPGVLHQPRDVSLVAHPRRVLVLVQVLRYLAQGYLLVHKVFVVLDLRNVHLGRKWLGYRHLANWHVNLFLDQAIQPLDGAQLLLLRRLFRHFELELPRPRPLRLQLQLRGARRTCSRGPCSGR
mmetsp:Transcript_10000/g.28395  ORF Transcript_10000/g.28395 Transcript_10000/m.28395 type:complete len:237 (-) Transcript_10000:2951-3661(-)